MTKREFLDIVFALAPTEANAIMDAFDEYVDSNEQHWIPVDLENNKPQLEEWVLVSSDGYVMQDCIVERGGGKIWYHGGNIQADDRYMPLPEPYKGGDGMMKWEAEAKGYTCNDCYLSMQNCHDISICCEDETGLCDWFEEMPKEGAKMEEVTE